MKKRIMACLLAAVAVFGIAGAFLFQKMTTTQAAAGDTGTTADGLVWQIKEDGTAEITQYNGKAAAVEIPDEIAGCRVTSIGKEAFYQKLALKEITLPDGLTDIAEYAFSECCRLTEITIPEGVTNIGKYAFSTCSSLERIEVSEENKTYASQDGVLYNKEQTELICCPMKKEGVFVSPISVKHIGEAAFYKCLNLTDILLPDDVTDIGENAFSYCYGLKSFIIPKSVTSIGKYAFSNCSGLTEVVVPETLTSMEYGAFNNCSSLLEITLPKSLTSIGAFVFYNCVNLEAYCYPDSDALEYVMNNRIPYWLIEEAPAP